MRANTQKSFPYPVIRDEFDDYLNETFEIIPSFELSEDSKNAKFLLDYSLSSTAIKRQIANGNACYLSVFSCRDTFYHKVFESFEASNNIVEINLDDISGKLEVESFVYIKNDLSIESKNINQEYLPKDIFSDSKFKYLAGSIVAQAKVYKFNFVPDIFNFSSSLFQLKLDPELPKDEWAIDTNQDRIIIRASNNIIEIERELSNHDKGKSALVNSIYFAAVMHAVSLIKETPSLVDEVHWAKVFEQRMNIKKVTDADPIYKVASKLMDWPLSDLESLTGAEE
ncbi:hypothetical protein N9H80_00855 [Candidatus Pseudothioglobus singularis]|jgi:hypothetical protein|nr:hypothetical protein [Candidatus Pseudothioglobus singularis]